MGEKSVFRAIAVVSAIVFILILWLSSLPKSESIPSYAHWFPRINAMINGTASVLLLFSLYFIKRKNITMHGRLNITTFILSSVFLISYVWFHSFGIETKYPATPLRPVYLFILITHIILAAAVLPLVLFTFYLGLSNKVERHRKVARWSYPVWLYVTVSGVVVYLMISPYYNF